jgi:hypothetical protein
MVETPLNRCDDSAVSRKYEPPKDSNSPASIDIDIIA